MDERQRRGPQEHAYQNARRDDASGYHQRGLAPLWDGLMYRLSQQAIYTYGKPLGDQGIYQCGRLAGGSHPRDADQRLRQRQSPLGISRGGGVIRGPFRKSRPCQIQFPETIRETGETRRPKQDQAFQIIV